MFLANAPGEHGLKQAARTIDAALGGAHSALAVDLRDALQGVAFLLDELAGLLRSSPAYDGLGLEVRLPTLAFQVVPEDPGTRA